MQAAEDEVTWDVWWERHRPPPVLDQHGVEQFTPAYDAAKSAAEIAWREHWAALDIQAKRQVSSCSLSRVAKNGMLTGAASPRVLWACNVEKSHRGRRTPCIMFMQQGANLRPGLSFVIVCQASKPCCGDTRTGCSSARRLDHGCAVSHPRSYLIPGYVSRACAAAGRGVPGAV